MTTDAPPEKMMPLEYYGQHKDNCVPGQGAYDEPPEPCSCGFDEAVHMAREAARRLAPRVGDDEPEFPQEDLPTAEDVRGIMALSAPPAASADERVDREALMGVIADGMKEYVMEGPAGLCRRIERFILEHDHAG
jgi:hypothetical protein